jgi:hypothetical protein
MPAPTRAALWTPGLAPLAGGGGEGGGALPGVPAASASSEACGRSTQARVA